MDKLNCKNYSKYHVCEELKKNGMLLKYASDKLKNNRNVVITAVSNYGMALEYASDRLKNDKQIVLHAISNSSSALFHASDKLRDDEDVILAAVSKFGYTLKYASENLKNNKNIVCAALISRPDAFEYMSKELKYDLNFCKEIFILICEIIYNSPLYRTIKNQIDSIDELLWNTIIKNDVSDELKYFVEYTKKLYNFKTYDEVCKYMLYISDIKKHTKNILVSFLDIGYIFI